MSMAVVMVGSVVSGFRVVGPFETLAEARSWADGYEDFEAMAVELKSPETPWQELVEPRFFERPAGSRAGTTRAEPALDGGPCNSSHSRRSSRPVSFRFAKAARKALKCYAQNPRRRFRRENMKVADLLGFFGKPGSIAFK